MSEEPANNPVKLAVLLSGGGRTLQNLAEHIERGELNATIQCAIASSDTAYGLTRAAQFDIPTQVNPCRTEAQAEGIWQSIRACDADLVVLAGWLRILPIAADFRGRVINIHPALLPSFGGKGMYGHHVHEAVLARGCKLSGCTVHYCDDEYDNGPIIVQRSCPVMEDDTPDTLAARVFEQECIAYPEAIQLIAEGRVSIEERRTRIL